MGFFKNLLGVPGMYLSVFKRRKKKKKSLFAVEVRMDKATKNKINEMMCQVTEMNATLAENLSGAGDAFKQAAQAIYKDLKDSGQLDKLVGKLGELLAKAGAVIETKDTKTITVGATPDHPHIIGDKVHVTGTKGARKTGTLHRRPERKDAKKPNGGNEGDGAPNEGGGEPSPTA